MTGPLPAALAALGQQLAAMSARIDRLERGQRAAQLPYSTIDNGALLITDDTGAAQIQLGLQPDGTFAHVALSTAEPPVPSQPVVQGGIGGLYAIWDGTLSDGSQPPADFAMLQVHCSQVPAFTPDAGTLQGSMASAGVFGIGGLDPSAEYYVAFAAVSASGMTSGPSAETSGTPAPVAAATTPGSLPGTAIATGTITGAQIAASTITTGLLAAGIIYAGIVDGTMISGATVVADGTSGEVLVYQGAPAAGNLIGSWSATPGGDEFGNTWLAGLTVGTFGSAQMVMLPNVNSQLSVTSAITGIFESMLGIYTQDAAQEIPGLLGSVLLGTGTAAKMATALMSPLGSGSGIGLMLEAQNDGGTDTPVATFGIITTPDASTEIFSPVLTITPYAVLAYSGTSGQAVVTVNSGTGTIPVPAGVSAAKAECWGAGSGGCGGRSGGSADNGASGGGGEYACEPSLTVTPGGSVSYAVGAGGAAGSGTSASGAGGTTTLTGTSVTVTANGGSPAQNNGTGGGAGGTGSGNAVHFSGGTGASDYQTNLGVAEPGTIAGCSGASSAGPGGAGKNGSLPAGSTATIPGAVGPSGSGAGGSGGAYPGNGGAPQAPGGGGGGGSTGATSGHAGAAGRARLTYSTGTPPLLLSVAAAAGTDQFGTAYPAGMKLAGPDGNSYNAARLTVYNAVSQTISATGSGVSVNGGGTGGALAAALGTGVYKLRFYLMITTTVNAGTPTLILTFSGAVSGCGVMATSLGWGATAEPVLYTSFPATWPGPTMTTAHPGLEFHAEGLITVSSPGTLGITAVTSSGIDTYVIGACSTLEVWPVY